MISNATVLHRAPLIATADGFLSEEDCAEIITTARDRMHRAKVTLDEESAVIEGRSGSNCWLQYALGGAVERLGTRVARWLGLPLEHAESLQVIHYGPGQEYRPHYDAYDLGTARGQRWCRYGGQRICTALVYLNTVEAGGSTVFPHCNLDVEARMGRVVVFNNVGETLETPHPDSLHGGAPVLRGEKWACNLWFHARPIKEKQHFLPTAAAAQAVGDQPLSPTPRAAAGAGASASAELAKPLERGVVTLYANRARKLWADALSALPLEALELGDAGSVTISYWDTYGNSQPPESTRDAPRHIRLIDRKHSNPLANKASLARSVATAPTPLPAPRTFFDAPSALAFDGRDDKLWFIKHALGAGGKDMRCVRGSELESTAIAEHFIIQEAIEELALIDGRKFTARAYLLAWQSRCWVFDEGFVLLHGLPYDAGSTDYAVQIDHRGYQNEGSAVQMYPLRAMPMTRSFLPGLHHLLAALQPILAPCVRASGPDRYLLLGVDYLVQRSQKVQLLEINTVPNFIHSPRINAEVNIPLFRETLSMLLTGASLRFSAMPVWEG